MANEVTITPGGITTLTQKICVKFRDSLMYHAMHPMTILDVWKANAAYAGVHDVQYPTDKGNTYLDANLWTNTNNPSRWTINSSGINASSASGVSYIHSKVGIDNAIETPYSFVVNFRVAGSGRGGFSFRGDNDTNFFYLYLDSTAGGFVQQVNGVDTNLSWVTYKGGSDTQPRDVTVMVREYQYTSIDTDVWLLMSCWINGHHFLSHAHHIGTGKRPGHAIGFRVGTSSTLSWTEQFIPTLAMVVDWATLDPNEKPLSAIQKTIGERHIRGFVRYNGTLRLWQPRPSATNWIIGFKDMDTVAQEFDDKKLVTHVRQWGAFHRAEYFDEDGVTKYGRRFKEFNNPNLFTEKECQAEAIIGVQEAKADANRVSFTTPFNPFIEPEDVIQTSDGKRWFVDSIDTSMSNNALMMTINARLYVFDT